MTTLLEQYLADLQKEIRTGKWTEHTYRPALKHLIERVDKRIVATNEPGRIACGAPDFTVSRSPGPMTVGYVECKDLDRSLDEAEVSEQLKRYRRSLHNLVLTNYLEFRWYIDGKQRGKSTIAALGPRGRLMPLAEGARGVEQILSLFVSRSPRRIASAKELAQRMADLALMIRDMVVEAFERERASRTVMDLRTALSRTLVPELADDQRTSQFADIFAQTLTYGLFAARVNHSGPGLFSRLGAAREIPKTNPFLRKLFEIITGTELDEEPYAGFVDDLVQLLQNADINSILEHFGKSLERQDPIVHFYETFLAAYDPNIREMRGVYYTPEPVVSYVVRSIDLLLRDRFRIRDGLADTSKVEYETTLRSRRATKEVLPRVLVLDPACGTGTFLYYVIDLIRDRFVKRADAGMWSGYVKEHILPRVFGFELLMAPYAVAHLKLGMQLAAQDLDPLVQHLWRYDFPGDDRLGIYLTNTLEPPTKPVETALFFLRILTEEAAQASRVKGKLPILVVLGNPPYSNYGRMNRTPWILGLLEDYKQELEEKKLNLDDDFIKFIRFGQWRIDHTGAGILAFITNNTYLDGLTHRRMRQCLMESFSHIYILNLHGSIRKGERTPEGEPDDNVFDIRQGVAIGIFVKEPGKRGPALVDHADLWGTRNGKYDYLRSRDVERTKWTRLDPQPPMFYFVPKDLSLEKTFEAFWSLADIMPLHHNGIKTDRDDLFFDFDREALRERMRTFYSPRGLDAKFAETYGVRNSTSYDLLTRREKTKFDARSIRLCLYRPFDLRLLYYGPGLTSRPAWEVMRHMIAGKNTGLITTRQTIDEWAVLATDQICGHKSVAAYDINTFFPLYLYPSSTDNEHVQGEVLETSPWPRGPRGRIPNLNPAFIEHVSKNVGLKFVPDGSGDLRKTFGPEDVLHYLYAVLHWPEYRARYQESLRKQFARVPVVDDVRLFRSLCNIGTQLLFLHLLQAPSMLDLAPPYPVPGSHQVEDGFPAYVGPGEFAPKSRQRLRAGRIYINAEQFFEGVAPDVWDMYVGGYQVCERWLRDRRGRRLSYEERMHYQRTLVALQETLSLMTSLDKLMGRGKLLVKGRSS